ncbi:MAG: HAMP domain-containing histidine kinase [Syntrophobacteraceae bacterium]|nr:HAMP domain-containing histidine kinase [Syntrophobacteraceae bacterium]
MVLSRAAKALRSIHIRLLLVILMAGIGMNVLVLAALSAHRAILADAFGRGVAQYVRYLAKDLGSPPNLERARELAGSTGMMIHYFSPEASWSTSGRMPSVPWERLHMLRDVGRIRAGFFRGNHYVVYKEGNDRKLVFEIARNPERDQRLAWIGLFLVFLVTMLFVGSYWCIRRIMAPLRPLTEGVRRLGSGELDHRVGVKGSNELGELAAAFNRMAEQLQQLMDSKDRMLLDVSHELRSPLTRMKLALAMAPEGPLKESLMEDVTEMERMVTTILENARAQSGGLILERQRIDLLALVRDEVKLHENLAPGVRLENGPEAAELSLDPEKTRMVIRNLLENALKYSREASVPVTVRVHALADAVLVSIQDRGIGIPQEDLPFVFEPFYRVDPSRSRETGGFGLGLSLCKAIMEAHGGSISIESQVGIGTTAHLHFPCEKPEPE